MRLLFIATIKANLSLLYLHFNDFTKN